MRLATSSSSAGPPGSGTSTSTLVQVTWGYSRGITRHGPRRVAFSGARALSPPSRCTPLDATTSRTGLPGALRPSAWERARRL